MDLWPIDSGGGGRSWRAAGFYVLGALGCALAHSIQMLTIARVLQALGGAAGNGHCPGGWSGTYSPNGMRRGCSRI